MVSPMQAEFVMTENEVIGLQTQINSLGQRMEKGFDEIKQIVSGFDARVRSVELKEANCNPLLNARVDAAWRKLDEQDQKMKEFGKTFDELEKTVAEFVSTNRILKWILGVLTALMIAYLVKLLVGG